MLRANASQGLELRTTVSYSILVTMLATISSEFLALLVFWYFVTLICVDSSLNYLILSHPIILNINCGYTAGPTVCGAAGAGEVCVCGMCAVAFEVYQAGAQPHDGPLCRP